MGLKSPECGRGILALRFVRGHEDQPAEKRLRDKDSVERIAVEIGEAGDVEGRRLVDAEAVYAVRVARPWNESVGSLRQRQASEPVLDRDLPG